MINLSDYISFLNESTVEDVTSKITDLLNKYGNDDHDGSNLYYIISTDKKKMSFKDNGLINSVKMNKKDKSLSFACDKKPLVDFSIHELTDAEINDLYKEVDDDINA